MEEALQAFAEELQESERQALVLQHRGEEHERRIGDNQVAAAEASTRQEEIEGQIGRLDEHRVTMEAELSGAGQQLTGHSEQLAVLEDRLTRERASLDEATRLNLEFIESDASHRSHLRELQVKQENRRERMDSLAEERETVLRQGRESAVTLEGLAGRRDETGGHRSAKLSELATWEREEVDLESKATDVQEKVSALQGRSEAARSTRDLLQRLQDDFEGYGQGAREVLRRHGTGGRV